MTALDVKDYYDKFTLKVLSSEQKVSQVKTDERTGQQKGGNPMFEMTFEFTNNKPMRIKTPEGVQEVSPDGLQVKHWLTKVPSTLDMVNQFLVAIGMEKLTHPSQMDQLDGNMFIGKTFEGMVSWKQEPIKNSNGEPVTHNGQPVTTARSSVKMFLPKQN